MLWEVFAVDAIVQLAKSLHIVLLFLCWLPVAAFVAFWQAVAGLLYPTQSERMARRKRWTVACLLPALAAVVLGVGTLFVFQRPVVGLAPSVAGLLGVLAAGCFGRLAESEFKEGHSSERRRFR